MIIPSATYRLQFRSGMDFDRAAGIVPYLRDLGVSHLYASPIFAAVTGSTHGYDVIDHNEIDPALGGRAGFERLSAALKRAGLGLILDIVPNHMAASLENQWWFSVVEWGARSPYGAHFDIDWSERLTLPILGRDLDEVLGAGELAFRLDPKRGTLALAYFDTLLPLAPETYGPVLARIDHPAAAEMAEAGKAGRPETADEMHGRVRSLLANAADAAHLSQRLAALSEQRELVAQTHDAQPWRLTFWKDARKHLSYRRFFEVTGLAGVRVERDHVFDDVHRLILELVRSGQVDGLRVDHVDGLADPGAYLRRLRHEVGPDIFLVVEKILAEREALPADWPIAGTTGYEFIASSAAALVEDTGVAKLQRRYDEAIGHRERYRSRTARREISDGHREFCGRARRAREACA